MDQYGRTLLGLSIVKAAKSHLQHKKPVVNRTHCIGVSAVQSDDEDLLFSKQNRALARFQLQPPDVHRSWAVASDVIPVAVADVCP